jgi:hypothetical protein
METIRTTYSSSATSTWRRRRHKIMYAGRFLVLLTSRQVLLAMTLPVAASLANMAGCGNGSSAGGQARDGGGDGTTGTTAVTTGTTTGTTTTPTTGSTTAGVTTTGSTTGGTTATTGLEAGGVTDTEGGATTGAEGGATIGAEAGAATAPDGAAAQDAGTVVVPPGCTLPSPVSFKTDVQPFLATSCGNGTGGSGCHVLDATSTAMEGGYDHAYDWITGTAHASSCPETPTPFRFQVVMAVMQGADPASCSKCDKMPVTSAADPRTPLTSCQLSTLQSWLDEPYIVQLHRNDGISPTTPYAMPPFN